MAIIDELMKARQGESQQPVAAPQNNWVNELIGKRYEQKTERLKRTPIGFQFNRDPFDPSSYYKQLGTFRDISRLATNVTVTEANNRAQKEAESRQQDMMGALNGIDPRFVYDDNYKATGGKGVKLKGVSSSTAAAASYFSAKYGIKNVGGYRSKGSVPGSDHPKGRAADLMTNSKSQGTALANDAVKNYKQWDIKYVIWYDHIWTPRQGWHKYSGPSNHRDHVHLSFNS